MPYDPACGFGGRPGPKSSSCMNLRTLPFQSGLRFVELCQDRDYLLRLPSTASYSAWVLRRTPSILAERNGLQFASTETRPSG